MKSESEDGELGRLMAGNTDPPVVLIKWYDYTKWLLERIDSFPKNQRFIFGQRLADHVLDVLDLLLNASYSANKREHLATANRKIEMLRWLVRLAHERNLITTKQYQFSCRSLNECGRMVGGWLKQTGQREDARRASTQKPV